MKMVLLGLTFPWNSAGTQFMPPAAVMKRRKTFRWKDTKKRGVERLNSGILEASSEKPSIGGAIFWEPPRLPDGTAAYVSATYNSLLQRYFGDIGNSGLYNNNTQYYDNYTGHINNNSTLGGAWVDTSPYPPSDCSDSATPNDCLLDGDIQNEVLHALSANPGWTMGPNSLFLVFTSKGEGSCGGLGSSSACAFTQYCGYHGWIQNGKNIAYADIPYLGTNLAACGVPTSPNNDFDADSSINVVSHEHMESVTDPFLNAWFDNGGNEIGDKCAWNFGPITLDGGQANEQWNGNYYIVQQEWSNASNSCVLSSSGPLYKATSYVGSDDGSIYALNALDGVLRWRYQTGAGVNSGATVVNGTLYIGSRDHYVYALNPTNGLLIWRYQTGAGGGSSLGVAGGIVFIGSADHNVYALNAGNGTLNWQYTTGNVVSGSPMVSTTGY